MYHFGIWSSEVFLFVALGAEAFAALKMPVRCVGVQSLSDAPWKDSQGARSLCMLGSELLTYNQGSYDPFL